MYGKFFSSAFTGSMYGAGPDVFAVWAYVIANTADSQVELNPPLLASMIGTTPERVRTAIDFLCAPDPNSRSKTEEGRRLVREGEFAYRVPNFAAYRAIRNEEERREYNRQKKREERERKKSDAAVEAPVNDSQRLSNFPSASASVSGVVAVKETERENQEIAPPPPHPDRGLLEHFPDASHQDAYLAYRESHRHPTTFDASVRNVHAPIAGGPSYPWEVIGEALRDMAASQVVFTPRALTGFCRKVGAAAHGDREGQRAEIRARIDADIAAGKRGEMF